MTAQEANLPTAIQATAAIVPTHYASEEQVARALARLGKPEAAALIQGKLPTTKAIRSGDLGEIYATEWIEAQSGGYRAPIKRLRWKDHRNMAMRGDDVIGISQDPQTQRLHFLKTERGKEPRRTDRPSPYRGEGRFGQGWRPAIRACAVLHFGASARIEPTTAR
ncbi:Hachiman antiphage defense system protein HamA [Methylomonas sp. HW2-6]|uniref:Hachiman antiphage defense system protein HamA n=1 Tax=Methylomonas sp. HW2-6 TaxID=3376687 RepID=UPI00404231DF